MGRQPCCDKVGLKKGPWTTEEDKKLINFILTNGQCCWRALPKLAGLLRCGKSCRLRWTNYLRPDLKRGLLSEYEEQIVIDLHAKLGNRWSKIASHLPGRTDNEIKNHWNTHIKKKLKKMGINPLTHKPISESDPTQQVYQSSSSSAPTTTNCTKKLVETDHQQQQSNDLVETPAVNSPLSTAEHGPTKIGELDAASGPVASLEGYYPTTIEDSIDSFFVDQVPLIDPDEILAPPKSPSFAPMNSRASSYTSSSSSLSSSGSLLVDLKDLELPGFDWSCCGGGPNTDDGILKSNGTDGAGFLWDGDELSNWDLPIGVDCVEINLLPEIFSHYAELDSFK